MTSLAYEEAFARLEEILEKMNTGRLTLEQSLQLYEEADTLITSCTVRLKEAEETIEQLMKQRDGSLKAEPLNL